MTGKRRRVSPKHLNDYLSLDPVGTPGFAANAVVKPPSKPRPPVKMRAVKARVAPAAKPAQVAVNTPPPAAKRKLHKKTPTGHVTNHAPQSAAIQKVRRASEANGAF